MSAPDIPPSGSSGVIPLRLVGPHQPALGSGGVPGASGASGDGWGEATRSPGPARWDDRGARRRKSSTSFGLVGRVVITVLLLLVLTVIAFGNILGVPVYLIVMVWALRDLWAPAHRPAPSPPRRAQAPVRSATQVQPYARLVHDEIPRSAPDHAQGPPTTP